MLTPDTDGDYLKLNCEIVGIKVKVIPLNLDVHLDGLWKAQTEYKKESDNPAQDLIWTYMPFGPFNSKEEYRTIVEKNILLGSTDGKIFGFVISHQKAGEIIGFTTFLRINPPHRTCEIGHIWLDPRYRRQNLLDEAIWLMTQTAIQNAKYRRVEWKCDNANLASKKMAERNQFTFEGVHRNCLIVRGKNRDTAWFSITDDPDEWEKVRTVQSQKFNSC